MSSSAHYTGQVSESHSYNTQEIPLSLKSNNSAQSIRANNRHFQLGTSSASTQSSGGLLLFNIPPSNIAISRSTMFLRCRVTATCGAFPTYADAANSLFFSGPGPLTAPILSTGNAAGGAFVPQLSNGYSWIQRLTLFGTGATVVDQCNYVNDTMNLMLMHNTSPQFLQNDGQVELAVGRGWDRLAATQNAYVDLCLPIPLSCFNNSQHDFPLYLCNNPMTLQIDMASFARAMGTGATTACTEYTVSNAFLCYEALELPHSLIEAERQAVKTHPFIMPLTSWLNVQVPIGILSSYTLGLNASSVRNVFLLPFGAAAYVADGSADNYVRSSAADAATGWGAGINFQVYCDGNVKNSTILDNPVVQHIMLKQSLHNNIQSNVLQPSISTLASYVLNYYALGMDMVSFDDESTIFGATPVSNINIQLTGYTNNPTFLTTVLISYDTLLAFKEGGLMEIKR